MGARTLMKDDHPAFCASGTTLVPIIKTRGRQTKELSAISYRPNQRFRTEPRKRANGIQEERICRTRGIDCVDG
jgi:hypothetical protein